MLGRLLCWVGRHKWACLCGKHLYGQGFNTECKRCYVPSNVQLMPLESFSPKGQFKYHYCYVFLGNRRFPAKVFKYTP